jgi:hypothetical protein
VAWNALDFEEVMKGLVLEGHAERVVGEFMVERVLNGDAENPVVEEESEAEVLDTTTLDNELLEVVSGKLLEEEKAALEPLEETELSDAVLLTIVELLAAAEPREVDVFSPTVWEEVEDVSEVKLEDSESPNPEAVGVVLGPEVVVDEAAARMSVYKPETSLVDDETSVGGAADDNELDVARSKLLEEEVDEEPIDDEAASDSKVEEGSKVLLEEEIDVNEAKLLSAVLSIEVLDDTAASKVVGDKEVELDVSSVLEKDAAEGLKDVEIDETGLEESFGWEVLNNKSW